MTVRNQSRGGFLLIESLVGLALFSMFIAGVGIALLASHESAVGAADRVRGIMLSERALEAARSMRAEGFSQVTTGFHGVKIGSGGVAGTRWVFDGTSAATPDGFTTVLNVESLASDWLRLTATTSWNHGKSRSGSVVLVGELTDWQSAKAVGSWTSPQVQGSYTDGGTPLFNDVAVSGNYAYVTSETSAGGRGLYVFDISNPASPARVASSFNLGAAGYDVAVKGRTLYVLTGDTSQEVRAYNITSPVTLSADNLITSYNLPGSARGRSMALNQSTLFVGAAESATEKELYSFNVASSGAITALHSVEGLANIEDLAVRAGYAYLASSYDALELHVGNVSNPSSMSLPSGSGVNLTDVQDALAVARAGTAALIGRANGASIDELVLFDVQNRVVPTGAPGPWVYEAGGDVNDTDIEPGGKLAFVASGGATKQLRVMDVAGWEKGIGEEKGYYTFASAVGRGLLYDAWSDKVYFVTGTQFLIFRSN